MLSACTDNSAQLSLYNLLSQWISAILNFRHSSSCICKFIKINKMSCLDVRVSLNAEYCEVIDLICRRLNISSAIALSGACRQIFIMNFVKETETLFLVYCKENIKKQLHIGLFMNTGPYSHDIMMQQVADDLSSRGFKVTMLQIRVFNFNFTLPKSNYNWSIVQYDYSRPETNTIMNAAMNQIWHGPVPMGGGTFNYKGIFTFHQLYESHAKACQSALKDADYMRKVQEMKLDIIAIDYVLNECAIGISSILKIPRVYLSNYPMVEVYTDNFGVPSNPSYVPALVSHTGSKMSFFERVLNTATHVALIFARVGLFWRSGKMFRDVGYSAELRQEERDTIFYGTPLEFLLDGPRPIANTVKYFGCMKCSGIKPRHVSDLYGTTPNKDVIVASFGTCSSASQLPERVIKSFSSAFSQFKQYQVVLQIPGIEKYNNSLPSNVIAAKWIPLMQLLGDPSVKLLISHGGVSTTLEAINNAVPVLGIPLQGDQMYNVGRLVEKGVADVLFVNSLSGEKLSHKLRKMLQISQNDSFLNPDQYYAVKKYREKTLKMKLMLSSYQTFERKAKKRAGISAPAFWIEWAARHFTSKDMRRKFLVMKFTDRMCGNIFCSFDSCNLHLSNLVTCTFPLNAHDFGLTKFPAIR
ncbi:UDP-glucuronosyltransferase 2B31 [Trichinella britovi]|uniref:glucuronosyltransferase n=1 Tax=Trichinella britovi TaxID=45882 RepID=A0A0V1D8E6_TRIBR|nr:UDP-glucuronosyltransferase 2B31 [Trichinella britovi]